MLLPLMSTSTSGSSCHVFIAHVQQAPTIGWPAYDLTNRRAVLVVPCANESCHLAHTKPHKDMIAIEGWLELIDPPDSEIWVVQTHRNWEARFTAASLSLALNHRTVILPWQTCWRCFQSTIIPPLFRRDAKTIVVM